MLLIVPAVFGAIVTVPVPVGLIVTVAFEALRLTVLFADSVVNAPVLGVVDPIAGGLIKLNEPPSANVPEAVIGPPVMVIPLTFPALVATLVTVPPVAPVTAAQASPPAVVYCKYVAFDVGATTNPVVPEPV
jgi:hypothetical protein